MGIVDILDIAEKMEKHRSTISQHMSILENANLVRKIEASSESNRRSKYSYALQKNATIILATVKHIIKDMK